MTDRVADEVGDETLDEPRIAARARRTERGVDGDPVVIGGGDRRCGDGGEIDGLTAVDTALAAGEREERVDQLLLLFADGEQLLARVPVGVDARVRVAQRELEQRSLERERRAQLVRGVGDELSLRVEGGLEPGEQAVDGVAEPFELVVRPLQGEPAMEVAGGDVPRGVGDRPHRAKRAAGDHPAEPEREHGHQCERERGVDEQLVQRGVGLPFRCGECDLAGPEERRLRVRCPGLGRRQRARDAGGLDGDHALPPGADEEASGVLVIDENEGDRKQRRGRQREEPAVHEREPKPDRRCG